MRNIFKVICAVLITANVLSSFAPLTLAADNLVAVDNPSFEIWSFSDMPDGWSPYNNNNNTCVSQNTELDNVWDGEKSVIITDNFNDSVINATGVAGQDGLDDDNCGIKSSKVNISPNTAYSLKCMTKELSEGSNFTVYLNFYDSNNEICNNIMVQTSGSMKWSVLKVECEAPANACYADIWIISGVKNYGSCSFDAISLKKSETPVYQDVNINWEILETNHPRLYFTGSELVLKKNYIADETLNNFGYSGKLLYDEIIANADKYVSDAQNGVHYTKVVSGVTKAPNAEIVNGNVTLDFGSWETLPDPNANYKNIGLPVSKVGYLSYPCMSTYFQSIRDRMDTLSLAYSLTGDEKYSSLAISYALDLSKWSGWGDKSDNYESETYPQSQQTAILAAGVCSVYDMCYEKMSDAEKLTISSAIMSCGVEPLYNSISSRVLHNEYANRAAGLATCVMTIINDINDEILIPAIDRAYNYMAWLLHQLRYSGAQEGYHYTSHTTECMIKAMDHIKRVTGNQELVEHEYFTKILVPWVANFLAPGNNFLPPISDSSYKNNYFGTTMSVINSVTDNGLAGFYLSKIGGAESVFDRFIYTDSAPVVTVPSDNLIHIKDIGYGGLRTGYLTDDILLTLISNDSRLDHNHYDQNSIALFTNSDMLAADPGYTNTGLSEDYTNYSEKFGHNTLLVDGIPQNNQGNGHLETVISDKLLSYLKGSAPNAYGYNGKYPVLDVFERHAVLINHPENPYYIIFDDISSVLKHKYSWNLNVSGYSEFMVDGKNVEENSSVSGNEFLMRKNNLYMYGEFIGNDKLDFNLSKYKDTYGPLVLVSGEESDSYQFMTLLTACEKNNLWNTVSVSETYDSDSLLGAKIKYDGDLTDVIVFNRSEDIVSADELASDGKMMSALSISDGKANVLSATDATVLKYKNENIFTSDTPITFLSNEENYKISSEDSVRVSLNIGDNKTNFKINGNVLDYTKDGEIIIFSLPAGNNTISYSLINEPEKEYGSGTENDPYIISTEDDLLNITNSSGKYYKLNNRINLSSNWQGIKDFAGYFDGNNKVIYLDNTTDGVFRNILSGSSVENLITAGTIASDVTTYSLNVGAIAGELSGILKNCTNYASNVSNITSSGSRGGLIGTMLSGSECSDVYNYGSIYNRGNTGGVVGLSNYRTKITNALNAGAIESIGGKTGGIAGWNYASVTNAYNSGVVKGETIGGIAGCDGGAPTYTNCFNIGEIYEKNATKLTFGGILGYSNSGGSKIKNSYNAGFVNSINGNGYIDHEIYGDYNSNNNNKAPVITNSYYLNENLTLDSYDGTTALKSLELSKYGTITNVFDFENTWILTDGYMYPQLKTLPYLNFDKGSEFNRELLAQLNPSFFNYNFDVDVSELSALNEEEKNSLVGEKILLLFNKFYGSDEYSLEDYGFLVSTNKTGEYKKVSLKGKGPLVGAILKGNYIKSNNNFYAKSYAVYIINNKPFTFESEINEIIPVNALFN